ncbi:MAG: insulinase family protein [Clostridia bacterium]|nr:insulinase family protein [Clostridia bacterium]
MALTTFPNGLRLQVNEMPELNTATVCVNLVGGYQGETQLLNGTCAMIAELLTCGTHDYPSNSELLEKAKSDGLVVKIDAQTEFIQIEVSCLKNKIDKAIEFIYDILFNSNFDYESIEQIRAKLRGEIEISKLNPANYLNQLSNQSLFARTGLANLKLGNAKSIGRITREKLLEQLQKYQSPKNIVISVGGAVNEGTVVELISRTFYERLKNEPYRQIKYVSQIYDFEGFINIKNRPFNQSRIQISFPGLSFKNEDHYALEIMCKPLEEQIMQSLANEKYYKQVSVDSISYANNGKLVFSVIVDVDHAETFVEKLLFCVKSCVESRGLLKNKFNAEKSSYITKYVLDAEKSDELTRLCANALTVARQEYSLDNEYRILSDITYEDAMDILEEIVDYRKINIAYLGRPIGFDFLKKFITD